MRSRLDTRQSNGWYGLSIAYGSWLAFNDMLSTMHTIQVKELVTEAYYRRPFIVVVIGIEDIDPGFRPVV